MKKIIFFTALVLLAALMMVPVFAETADTITSEVTEKVEASEDTEKFSEIMTELYEHWQVYTETEGDNGFEKLVNFAWKFAI